MARRRRADTLLTEQGLVASREEARTMILAGRVRVGADQVVQNPSELWDEQTRFVLHRPYPYVSRGAAKLQPALGRYLPDLQGLICLDVGAATGGFTDLMLQHGARRVYAVDVGYGQLHQKLRQDPRVCCLERLNARHLSAAHIPDPIALVTIDVSFISLTKILPAVAPLLRPDAWAMALVKPQFEARREEVGKGGVIRDPAVRQRVVDEIVDFADRRLNWHSVDTIPSPIRGPKGNQEYVAVFRTAPA
jgi:23S rRNA (cytidine1920-2'-O)/16S rRNA (cytidine1409-2'-O)-methyltransferase